MNVFIYFFYNKWSNPIPKLYTFSVKKKSLIHSMWIFVLRKIYSNTFTFLLLRNLCSEVLGYFYYSKPWDSLRQLSRHLATACWQAPGQRSLGQTVTQPCQWCAPKITMWPRATAQYSWLNLCSVFGFRKVKTKSAWAWQGCRSQKIFFFIAVVFFSWLN